VPFLFFEKYKRAMWQTMCHLQTQILVTTMVTEKIRVACLLPKKHNFQAILTQNTYKPFHQL
jgi:hypothetical protein